MSWTDTEREEGTSESCKTPGSEGYRSNYGTRNYEVVTTRVGKATNGISRRRSNNTSGGVTKQKNDEI